MTTMTTQGAHALNEVKHTASDLLRAIVAKGLCTEKHEVMLSGQIGGKMEETFLQRQGESLRVHTFDGMNWRTHLQCVTTKDYFATMTLRESIDADAPFALMACVVRVNDDGTAVRVYDLRRRRD